MRFPTMTVPGARVLAASGIVLACMAFPSDADPLAEVSPRPLNGGYPVACSNVAQDFGRLPPGEPVELTWEGFPRSDGSPRYVTDLLADPANTLVATFRAPDDAALFGPWRGQQLTYAVVVCYPTSATNPRPDYPLPNGKAVPRMQRGSEAPILPDEGTRWPLLLFSHGYGGSPLSNDYLEAIRVFASHGFVVAAPFHGDPRYALLSFDDLGSVIQSIANFERYTAMQATRPVSASATLDLLLQHPHWRDRVDPERIGGFGASQGGETLMLMGGAALTTSLRLDARPTGVDARLRAAVGYVPYFGQRLLPAFGRDNRGTDGVRLPYLAISGTADVTAPIGAVEDGMHRLASSRQLVALTGVEHGFDDASAGDIFTWSLAWFDAFVRGDRAARARVDRMRRVAGGGDDVVRIDYVAPAPRLSDEQLIVEYYHEGLNHYFLAGEPYEQEVLDAGTLFPGWRRTGYEFKGWSPAAATGRQACRFYGTPGIGPNSHFFTVDAAECEAVQRDPGWTLEGMVFREETPSAVGCPPDRNVVWRLYNNRMGGESNHRYLTSQSEIGDTAGRGWVVEGPVFCTPP
jgi:dienelactone hydrolase